MLQKLYQHLEQINANTRQQQTDMAQAEEWAGKISQQLDELNIAIRSLGSSPPRRSVHPLLPTGMAVIAVILLAILWTNMHGMSAAMHGISAAAASDRESSKAALAAYGVVNTRTVHAVQHATSFRGIREGDK